MHCDKNPASDSGSAGEALPPPAPPLQQALLPRSSQSWPCLRPLRSGRAPFHPGCSSAPPHGGCSGPLGLSQVPLLTCHPPPAAGDFSPATLPCRLTQFFPGTSSPFIVCLPYQAISHWSAGSRALVLAPSTASDAAEASDARFTNSIYSGSP